MDSRERVIRTLEFSSPDRAPRQVWPLPAINLFRQGELDKLLSRYPMDFDAPSGSYGPAERARGEAHRRGEYVDAWGCVWHALEDGVVGEVRGLPLANWSALDTYSPPWEIIDGADLSDVNRSCSESSKFIIASTETRPFERMQFLRGTENVFMDLAYGVQEACRLRDMLHDFFVRDIQMWAKTDVDAVSFMDDWGSQTSLLISPEVWRSFFKPLYKDYCDIIRGSGKYVFFHSDGFIEDIYPDLIEIGVSAVNSQLMCMNVERLAAQHKGRITFWGEVDRQHAQPYGTPEDCRAVVRRVRKALDDGAGGLIAQCEWGTLDPFENIDAIFDEWSR